MIQADEVHIHLLRLEGEALPGEDLYQFLSPEEAKHCGQRAEHAWGRLFLKKLAAFYLETGMGSLHFGSNPWGKPFLKESPCHFNLSHTQGLVACSFARQEIGIDVEKVDFEGRRSWPLLARRFFSPKEQDYLSSRPPESRPMEFLKIFTRKEAYGKALGRAWSASLEN